MKKLLLFLALFAVISGFCQTSGEAHYTTKINRHMLLPKTEKGEKMKDWIPEFQEFKNELLFTTKETFYQNVHEEIPPNLSESDRNYYYWNRKAAPPNEFTYCDLENKTTSLKKEILGKTFYVVDSLKQSNWKITGETIELAGMNCLKALYIPEEGDSTHIEVWFAPQIPVSSGPAGYGGLPGLILHLDKNHGEMVITLSKMISRSLSDNEIKAPKGGKKMTLEEFEALREKKMKQDEMQKSGWY